MLLDQYHRRFTYLRLSLTESCNFRCNYCLPNGSDCQNRAAELTAYEVVALVKGFALAGTRKIRLTGGEPTLRKDLCDIISRVKSVDGIEKVAMTTNGYRLKRDIGDWLAAGLDAINVSVDSLDPATFHLVTGQDRLQDILSGIDLALELGCRQVKLNTVLLKQYNGQALNQFLNFVKNRAISLRFIELMQTGDNQSFFNKQHQSGASIQAQLLALGWTQLPKLADAGPALEYSHPDYRGTIGLIMPYSKDFCNSCNRLRVSSLGDLYLCLFASEHRNLRHLLTGNNPAEIAEFVQKQLLDKPIAHSLQQAQTGLTKQLAMIGG